MSCLGLILLQATPATLPLPQNDPIALELLKWLLGAFLLVGVTLLSTFCSVYFMKRRDPVDTVKSTMDEHNREHTKHEHRHDRFEDEIRLALQEANKSISSLSGDLQAIEKQVEPFWRLVESTILPRWGKAMPEPNPVTEEQAEAMSRYVQETSSTPIHVVYLAREGFRIELDENTTLDQDTALFYAMCWLAANGRIIEYESGKISA